MTKEKCIEKSKNRVSYCCHRAADLRKGKTNEELSQKEAFVSANEEAKEIFF